MVALLKDTICSEEEIDDLYGVTGTERFSHRRDGAFPVHSHTARIRGAIRSRASASARRKAHEFSLKRRRSHNHWSWVRLA